MPHKPREHLMMQLMILALFKKITTFFFKIKTFNFFWQNSKIMRVFQCTEKAHEPKNSRKKRG